MATEHPTNQATSQPLQTAPSLELTPRKKPKAAIIATMIFVSLGLLASGYWFGYGQYFQSTDNAYVKANITNISAKVSGYVVETLVDDNQFVTSGTLLAKIDDREFQVKKSQSIANLQVQLASVEYSQAQHRLQQRVIIQTKSEVDSAQADLERSQQLLQRSQSLLKKQYSSQDEVDNAFAHLKVSKAQLEEAQSHYIAEQEKLNVIDSQIVQAQASVAEAQTELDQAELSLSYTKIVAPVDGIVGRRSVREGLFIQPGMPLISLVPTSDVWVEANFKETQLAKMQPGQKVNIELDAFPNREITGTLESFSPATGAQFALLPPENATGNFTKIVQRVPVKIHFDDQTLAAQQIIPGLSAVVTVDTHDIRNENESELAAESSDIALEPRG